MQQSKQEIQNYQEDEIDLRTLVYYLFEKKYLIAGLTGFITILAIIYSLTLSANYQATTSFTSAPSSSIVKINKLIYLNETKNSIFTSFLTSLSSYELQKNVFLENGFSTFFNKENAPIEDLDVFIKNFTNSFKINPPKLKASDMKIYLDEKPYSVSVTGSDKEAISSYLNMLIEQADKENILALAKLNKELIGIRLDKISSESSILLKEAYHYRLNRIEQIKEEDAEKIREISDKIDRARYKAKELRLSQLKILTEAAEVAKSLGIVENNFKLYSTNSDNADLTIAISESNNVPEWYSFGEKALLKRIEILKTRVSDDPFIPELITLNNQLNEVQNNNLLETLESRQADNPFIQELISLNSEKYQLESTEYNILGATSINLIRNSKIENISRSKRIIVSIALIVGFMMSIFLVLIMSIFKPDEKAPA